MTSMGIRADFTNDSYFWVAQDGAFRDKDRTDRGSIKAVNQGDDPVKDEPAWIKDIFVAELIPSSNRW